MLRWEEHSRVELDFLLLRPHIQDLLLAVAVPRFQNGSYSLDVLI